MSHDRFVLDRDTSNAWVKDRNGNDLGLGFDNDNDLGLAMGCQRRLAVQRYAFSVWKILSVYLSQQ
ncbi:hypothetical protein Tsubulata_010257, partial [Turnera subulata]